MRLVIFLFCLLPSLVCAGIDPWSLDLIVSRNDCPIVGWWDIEEGTGTSTTRDRSGNGHTATLYSVNEYDWETGPIPTQFWLSLYGYAVVADADDLSFTTGSADEKFSGVVCAKPSDTSYFAGLLGKWGSSYEWLFMFSSGHLRLRLHGGSVNRDITSDSTVASGVLNAYGFSYDGAADATLYIDGSEEASTASGEGYTYMSNTAADLILGAIGPSASYPIAGPFAFAVIYDCELTSAEQAAIAEECRVGG